MTGRFGRLGREVGAPLTKLIAFAVVTIMATGLLAATIANSGGGFDDTYRARFTDVTNLNTGDDVRVAGVRVGQVAAIRIVDRRLAEVEFKLDPDVQLTRSTTARLRFLNLIGQRYIALERGPGQVGEPLEPGDTIPLEQTKAAVDLTALFNGFKPLLRAINPDDINDLSYHLIQVLQGESGTVSSLLAHTASLTNELADRDAVIGQMITNLNTVLTTINERDAQTSQLVVTLQELVSGLAADRESIGESVEAIGVLTEVTASLLDEARPALAADIDQLGALATNLNDSEEILEHTIQFLPEKLTAFSRTATYGSWFNFYLCDFSAATDLGIVLPGDLGIETPPYANPAERCAR